MSLVALLLFGAVAAPRSPQALEEWLVEADVPRLMKTFGYPFEPARRGSGCGTINYLGARVNLGIATLPDPEDKSVPDRLVGLMLRIEIPVGEDIPLHEAGRVLGMYGPQAGFSTVPHLGRTVTVLQDIDFTDGYDEDKVRKGIDDFWRQGAAFARRHGGTFTQAPDHDWSKARFSDSLVLDRADKSSMERAAKSWGMTVLEARPFLPSTDEFRLQIDNVAFSVKVGLPGEVPFNGSYAFSGLVPLRPAVDVKSWAEAHSRGSRDGRVYPYYVDTAEVRAQLDMTKGVRLGDLRRTLISFAGSLKALRAEANGAD